MKQAIKHNQCTERYAKQLAGSSLVSQVTFWFCIQICCIIVIALLPIWGKQHVSNSKSRMRDWALVSAIKQAQRVGLVQQVQEQGVSPDDCASNCGVVLLVPHCCAPDETSNQIWGTTERLQNAHSACQCYIATRRIAHLEQALN